MTIHTPDQQGTLYTRTEDQESASHIVGEIGLFSPDSRLYEDLSRVIHLSSTIPVLPPLELLIAEHRVWDDARRPETWVDRLIVDWIGEHEVHLMLSWYADAMTPTRVNAQVFLVGNAFAKVMTQAREIASTKGYPTMVRSQPTALLESVQYGKKLYYTLKGKCEATE